MESILFQYLKLERLLVDYEHFLREECSPYLSYGHDALQTNSEEYIIFVYNITQ